MVKRRGENCYIVNEKHLGKRGTENPLKPVEGTKMSQQFSTLNSDPPKTNTEKQNQESSYSLCL